MNKFVILTVATIALGAMAFTFSNKEASSKTVMLGGIKFDKMTLEKAKKEAKKSKKLIFIDVYTTWCGPCKEMARTTFEADEVGKTFNKKFVNLKIDAENDADGKTMTNKYGVNAYPTLLFLNADGKMVKKLVGKQSEEKLLSVVESL